jgi:hypothetical protein
MYRRNGLEYPSTIDIKDQHGKVGGVEWLHHPTHESANALLQECVKVIYLTPKA